MNKYYYRVRVIISLLNKYKYLQMHIFNNYFYQFSHIHHCINCKEVLHILYHIHQNKMSKINTEHFHHQDMLPLKDISKNQCYCYLYANSQALEISHVRHKCNSKQTQQCRSCIDLQHLECKNFLHKLNKSNNQMNTTLFLLKHTFQTLLRVNLCHPMIKY